MEVPGLAPHPDRVAPQVRNAARQATMDTMPNAKMPLRAIRVPDELWRAAQSKAAEKGESVSDVLRRALERYVKTQ